MNFLKLLYKNIDRMIRLGGFISGIFIVLITGMIFYEVLSRAFFNSPTVFATELSIYSLIGSCFIGSGYALRTFSHITVDLVINIVSDKVKTILAILSNFLGLLFSVIFTWYGIHHVQSTYTLGVTSSSLLRVPMYLPELLLPIGGILLCFAFVLQIVDCFNKKGEPQA
ncbi:TRAP transporter small permease [Cytobacillus dafuensis]|uniref:TRAP transporter small permease n=1 Tax=Cytobacillus dafuensis TaxID=1742359 RepID=A0A5B8Z4Z3_CYTDA|nr:TRAP transporter small permease [Cytobacillus dafuensis]QED48174.1 TRAP transporter small permease [Cytobacillus dafuensis]